MNYEDFLKSKAIEHKPSGFTVSVDELNPALFDWQAVLVRWALAKGKSAMFADCGLGKTPMQLVWADAVCRYDSRPVLIAAPLAVSAQTKREGEKFGVEVQICESQKDVLPGVNITNYEKLHRFDPSKFSGVVLDESSIIKNFAGKIRNQVVDSFCNTPFRLCCTATPSPNDYIELGNHAEFLGSMKRSEMLAMFFINDTGDTGKWRLKGHVEKNIFWQWVCSWAVMMRMPEDIGFGNNGFILPRLNIHEHVVSYQGPMTSLFVEHAKTMDERRKARRASIGERVAMAADMINKSHDPWVAWCNLNDESKALASAIDGAVEVCGADSSEHKEKALLGFSDNKIKCLVTKPKIAGFGMNWQNCHNMAFVGLSDSYEQFYQAVRRCWRFGQKNEVNAHVVIGELEGAVADNIRRKESDMAAMFSNMVFHMKENMQQEIGKTSRQTTLYDPKIEIIIPEWLEAA